MITVIIPVFNAAAFVEEAVQSALRQPEVTEIILIEDGSLDESLTICEKIGKDNEIVTLLKHPEGKNKGAGASRNLGIQHATNEWIAFLDADDYYLENRFKYALEYVQNHLEIEAVGEPTGAIFHDEEGKKQYLKHLNLSADTPASTLITKLDSDVEIKFTFEKLLRAKNGHQHLNGLLIKKSSLLSVGLFNESLLIAQDTNLLLKVAYSGRLKCFSGSGIVAMRRIHSGNRWNASLQKRLYYYALHLQDLFQFVDHKALSRESAKKLVWYFIRSYKTQYFQKDNKVMKMYFAASGFFYLLLHNRLLLSKAYL